MEIHEHGTHFTAKNNAKRIENKLACAWCSMEFQGMRIYTHTLRPTYLVELQPLLDVNGVSTIYTIKPD